MKYQVGDVVVATYKGQSGNCLIIGRVDGFYHLLPSNTSTLLSIPDDESCNNRLIPESAVKNSNISPLLVGRKYVTLTEGCITKLRFRPKHPIEFGKKYIIKNSSSFMSAKKESVSYDNLLCISWNSFYMFLQQGSTLYQSDETCLSKQQCEELCIDTKYINEKYWYIAGEDIVDIVKKTTCNICKSNIIKPCI